MGILTAMVKIVVAIILGYIFYKKKVITDEASSVMSKIIIYGAGPCMIFSSILELSSENKDEVLTLIVAGVGLYVVITILAYIPAKLMRPGKELEGVYRIVLMIGNSAFLAFPIGEALLGAVGVSYLAILNVHSNILVYTLGTYLLTRCNQGKFKFTPKKLINPGVVAAIVALILFFLNVQVPDIVMAPIDFVGQLTSPMAMLIIGATIATYSFKSLFTNWRYYILAACRLIIFPIIIFFICYAIWGQCDLTKVIALHVSMPTAIIVTMLAITNHADSKTTSSVTGLTTIFCIGTIPLMWLFFGLFK